jgi:hypothetical protein
MQTRKFAENLSRTLERPVGTVLDYAKALRSEGLITKAGHGASGAQVTTAGAVSWMLALILEHRRGESIADNVRRARGLVHDNQTIERPAGFHNGLTFWNAPDAGTALGALVDDIRSGRLSEWAADEPFLLKCDVQSRMNNMLFTIMIPERIPDGFGGMCGFGFKDTVGPMERYVTLNRSFFFRLADWLGRLDSA